MEHKILTGSLKIRFWGTLQRGQYSKFVDLLSKKIYEFWPTNIKWEIMWMWWWRFPPTPWVVGLPSLTAQADLFSSTVCGNQNGERGLQSCLPLGKLSKKKKHPVFWALPKWGEGGCSQARLTVQSRKGTENCLDSFSASLIKQVGLGNWLGLALFGKGLSKLHSVGIKDMKNAFLRPLIMS